MQAGSVRYHSGMPPGAPSLESAPIRMRPPRRWNSLTWVILLGSLLLGRLVAHQLSRIGWLESSWQAFAIGGAAALLLAAAGLAVYAVLRPRSSREIEFGETAVRLPAGWNSPRSLEIAYARIFGLERMVGTRWSRMVIGVRGRIPITYLERAFERADDADRLLAELRRRIAGLPDGAERLRAIETCHRIHERAFSGAWPISLSVSLLLLVVFVAEAADGALRNTAELARLGGQVPMLVRDGQWWRLATAGLLHVDLFHLYANGIALLALGFLLERLFGGLRFAWLLLLGLLGSGIVSVEFGNHLVSVGASGAIFALIGAWFVLNTRHRDELPPALRLPGWYMVLIAVGEVASELLIPHLDTAAHAGGFVSGVVGTWLAFPHRSLVRDLARAPRRVAFATALLGAAFAGSVVLGAWSVLYGGEAYATRIVAGILDSDRAQTPENDVLTNELAWILASNPELPPGGFERPIARMQELVERNPDEHHYLDTLATLQYRAGDARAAVEAERRAISHAPPGSAQLYAAQLARFLVRQLETGSAVGADAWDGPLPVLERVAAREGEPGDFVVEVDLGGPLAHGAELEVLVWDAEALHSEASQPETSQATHGLSSLLHVELAPQPRSPVRILAADGTFARFPAATLLQLALVERAEPRDASGEPLPPGGWTWRAYPFLQAVAELP
jgi:rhomboid protease GluP